MMTGVQQTATFNLLLLLLTIFLHIATSTTYYVIPDDDDYSSHHYDSGANIFSLQHYLNNTSKYFVSHNNFHFMQGQYHMSNDLIFKDISNFSVIGIDQCVIICTSPASIVMVNVSNVTLQNIKLINCMKHHDDYFTVTYLNSQYMYDRHTMPSFSKVTNYHTSVFLCNSSSVTVHDMNIIATVITNFTAILIVNTQGDSKIINIKVKINSSFISDTVHISGLVVYYRNGIFNAENKLTITNFFYNNNYNTACENHFNCIVVLLFLYNNIKHKHHNKFNLHDQVHIQNSIFSNLKNSSILCYYGQRDSCRRTIMITNNTFSNNAGHPQLNMFYITFYSFSDIRMSVRKHKSLQNDIKFINCIFTRNINMEAIIYIRPPATYLIIGYIAISGSTFHKNINTKFIKVVKASWNIFYITTYIILSAVNVSCNEHDDGDNLILVTNGRILFYKSIFLKHNRYYENIISLQSSILVCRHYTEISGNYARYIVKAQSNSFLFMHILPTVNISNNVVYKTTKLVSASEKQSVHICPLQITITDLDAINHKFLLLNNTEMISKTLSTEIISYFNRNCTWFYDTIFQKTNETVFKSNNTFVNKTNKKRLIPLSVCPCFNNGSYNCHEAPVYSVFPGQELHIKLIVSPRWSKLSSTIVVANTIDDDCSMVDGYQLSQTL